MKKIILLFALVYFTASQSFAEDFRFALITDLHVSPGSIGEQDLQSAIDQINATPGLDFVLVDGDLTNLGDRASLELVKQMLGRIRIPCQITSGNHETKWSESGATDFGRIYGSDRFRFEYGGFLFLGFNTGPVIRMAEGHVAPQDVTWLCNQLRAWGTERPVILVTHYPLKTGDIDNWYTVTDSVRRYNIRAVLNGHYHANMLDAYDGIPAFICRSTLRDSDPVGGYSEFQVTSDSIAVYERRIGGEPQRWGAYSLHAKYFTADASGYERPDFSVNTTYAVTERWMTSLGNAVYSSPAVGGGRVYVGDDLGVLSCVRLKDGKLMWRFKAANRIIGTPAVAGGVVVFGSTDGNIYGVDARRGTQCWKITTAEPVLGAVRICNGVAYLGGSDHTFRAIDVRTGKQQWSYTGVEGYIEAMPLVYGNRVVFGAWDNCLYALDRMTGALCWKWRDGRAGGFYSPAAVWPVATAGRIFITAPDRVLTAIDAASGRTLWRTAQSTVRETIGLSADSARLYSKTMRDSVVCFSTRGDRPEQLWASSVGFGYEIAPSMPVEKDGVVYGSTMKGEVFALDPMTGGVLWRHKVLNSLVSTVVPIDSRRCLFTSSAGIVGLLEAPERK